MTIIIRAWGMHKKQKRAGTNNQLQNRNYHQFLERVIDYRQGGDGYLVLVNGRHEIQPRFQRELLDFDWRLLLQHGGDTGRTRI